MPQIRRRLIAAAGALALMLLPSAGMAGNIVDKAASAGNFTTLVKMIEAAGLAETLKGPGPFTVFAPTDEAFAKWPKKEVDLFLNPEKKKHLVRLLKHHVVAGKVKLEAISGKTSDAKTLEGTTVKLDGKGAAMIDGKKIVKADIVADNGVIHVIDTPLLPKVYRGSF